MNIETNSETSKVHFILNTVDIPIGLIEIAYISSDTAINVTDFNFTPK